MQIAVVGTGYVGLVTGTCLADMGHHVVCHDIDANKIAGLKKNQLPIYEPGLEELVAQNTKDQRLHFTTDLHEALAKATVCFVAVGTPPNEDGAADVRHVLAVSENVAKTAQHDLHLVIKSTVPVGTCDLIQNRVRELTTNRNMTIEVVSNPEFLKEGMAVEDFLRADRVVVGCASKNAEEVMRAVYKPFLRNGHPFLVMNRRSAEMTKYAANVMLATRISLMNEIALMCDALGADISAVRQGIGSDKRIGMAFLYAGVGYGGSCFPKDVKALAQTAKHAGVTADIIEAAEQVNKRQKAVLAERVLKRFGNNLAGKHFALWGLAFKPRTDDIREAPALTIAHILSEAGATLCAFDPEAMTNARQALGHNSKITFADEPYAALNGADALLLVTEWGIFRNPDFAELKKRLRQAIVFDGRNQLDPDELQKLNIEYHAIGRSIL